jgi:hypothetical protein
MVKFNALSWCLLQVIENKTGCLSGCSVPYRRLGIEANEFGGCVLHTRARWSLCLELDFLYSHTLKISLSILFSKWVKISLEWQHVSVRLYVTIHPSNVSALTIWSVITETETSFLTILSRDETWVSHFTPESKRQSLDGQHPRSPSKPRKFKQTLSNRKIMATIFGTGKTSFWLSSCRTAQPSTLNLTV